MSLEEILPGDWGDGIRFDPETLAALFAQFREDTQYLESHWAELRREHPDCWVAVFQCQVQAVGRTLESVTQELDRKQVPKSRTVIEYLRSKPIRMVL